MDENINSLSAQFYFLILKRLESTETILSTPELAERLERNFELLNISSVEKDKQIALITAITDYLSNDEKGLEQVNGDALDECEDFLRRMSDEGDANIDNETYWRRAEGSAYDECLAIWIQRLFNDYELDIENDDPVFSDTYKKFDLAIQAKTCIFTQEDTSDFIRLFLEYICPLNSCDTAEALDTQLQFLILSKLLERGEGTKVTLDELCTALEPNAHLWLARNRGRTEAAFYDIVLGELSELNKLEFNETISPKYEFDNVDKLIHNTDTCNKEGTPIEVPRILTWYGKSIIRAATGANNCYHYLADELYDYFSVEVDVLNADNNNSYFDYAPLVWNNILTQTDIEHVVSEVCRGGIPIILPNEILKKALPLWERKGTEDEAAISDDSIEKYALFESENSRVAFYAIYIKDIITSEGHFGIIRKEKERCVMLSELEIQRATRSGLTVLANFSRDITLIDIQRAIATLRDNAKDMPTYFTFKVTGWHKVGLTKDDMFLGAKIIDGSGTSYPLLPGESHPTSKGKLDAWKETAAEAIKDNIYAQIILATSFAGALIARLDIEPLIVNLCGKTSIGKSTFERLAVSVWSAPKDERLFLNFNSTELALLTRMNNNYGIMVAIDDTSTNRDNDLIKLIYQLSAKRSRDKIRKGNELEKVCKWATSMLLSSETSVLEKRQSGKQANEDKQGFRRRLLELRLKQGDLTRDAEHANSIDRSTRENYGLAGYAFVEFLFAHRETIFDEIQENFETYKKEWRNQAGGIALEQALAEPAALIHVTCDIINEVLGLEFDTDKIDEFTHQLAAKSHDHEDLTNVDNYDEACKLLYKLLPELKELALSESKGYIHILVADFAAFEIRRGFMRNSLRNLLNQHKLTQTNSGRPDHTILHSDGSGGTKAKKVISILAAEEN